MFLRHKSSGKILNHQSLSTNYKLSYNRSKKPIVRNWNYVQNTFYNMKKYCASDFGSSRIVANSNAHLVYQSTNRSIFDMDSIIPSRWSERNLAENETVHFKAMSVLGLPMMFYNRNIFPLDSITYKLLRKWNINRLLEDYELLFPLLFKDEISDALPTDQQIYQKIEDRMKNKPNEVKEIVDALKAYVLDFNNNAQVLKSDPKDITASVTSTVIDHTDANRAALTKLVNNISTDDLLELWGGVGSFTLNPFKVKVGAVIKEKTATEWAMAPFYSRYLFRRTRYAAFASEGLIKRYELTLPPLPKNVDYSKTFSVTNNINLKLNIGGVSLKLITNYYTIPQFRSLSTSLSPLTSFVTPKR